MIQNSDVRAAIVSVRGVGKLLLTRLTLPHFRLPARVPLLLGQGEGGTQCGGAVPPAQQRQETHIARALGSDSHSSGHYSDGAAPVGGGGEPRAGLYEVWVCSCAVELMCGGMLSVLAFPYKLYSACFGFALGRLPLSWQHLSRPRQTLRDTRGPV